MTPFIVTFYSYKGGVGRSLLAANIGVLTARRGKTLLWDLDIEAPGLHNIPGLTPSRPVKEGFFEWMIAWQESGKASNKADFVKLVKLACQTPERDRLFILPAYGANKDFAGLFQSIRWDDFLVRDLDSGLALFRGILDAFGKAGFETVLLDSRTGITDIGGLLAALLPHATVLVGNYGRQNTKGLAHVWQALYPASEGRIAARGTLAPLTRLLVASPIADELDLRAKGEEIWKEAFGLVPAEMVTIPFDQRLLFTEELYAATRPDTPVAKAYNDLERRIDKVRQQVIAENESARRNKDSRAQGKSFEFRVAHLLRLLGYTVEHEQLIDSNRVDLVVRKRADFGREELYFVECKDHQAVIPKETVLVFKTWLDGPAAREMQARGMVVAASDFSPAARRLALEQGIQALTFDELERSLFDFSFYLARIRQRYEASALAGNYVDQYLLLEKQPDEKPVPMLPHALQWVSGAGSRLWLVLGDYGTGKSTLVERFAYELARTFEDNPDGPVPIAINLCQFPNAISLESLIREHLETELRTVLNPEIVLHLLEAGRVVLLLDSFDEMGVTQAGRSVEEQFRQLAHPTAIPGRNPCGNRVLITSRSHYFCDNSSARQAMLDGGKLFEADSALGKAARAFDAMRDTLAVFTQEQIAEYLHKRLGMVEGDKARRFIEERYGLQDIASTPRFLDMIVASLPELIKQGENVSTGSLYLTYTIRCLNSIRWSQGKLNVELMHDLLERMACELWSRPRNQIHYTDIAGLLHREGGVARSLDSDQVDLELRTVSFLVRSADGSYRFSHRSFLEFFFAQALFRALQEGHFEKALTYGPINPEATTFLLDLTESAPESYDKLTEVIRTIFANPYNEGTSEFRRFLNLMQKNTSTTPLDFKGVMVSSTFTDLKAHRAALINIIDRSGFKAVVMEHDSAKSDVDVIESSLQMVQDSAAYILVISHKYGQTPVCTSRNPGKLSITELEFNEAVRLRRPILLFIMGEDHAIKKSDIEKDPEKEAWLNAFRERAKKMGPDSAVHRVYAEFNSLDEFKDKAAKAIFDLRFVFHKPDTGPFGGKGTTQSDDKKLKADAACYQNILKEELGYIRMLGLPGIESTKVNLNNDTFVPLRLSDRHERVGLVSKEGDQQGSEHVLSPDEIMKQAFHDRRGRRMLLVIGDPGAGKTTLLKYYALSAIEDYTKLGFSAPVNVFYLPLRDLVRDKEGRCTENLPAALAGWSAKHHQTIDAKVFNDWLNNDISLVLLDGLDEISNIEERKEVCHWIDHAFSGFSKAYIVVTSRATGYRKDEGIELESEYERADVQDFTAEQQERFLRNWFRAAFLKEPCEKGVNEESWQERQKAEAEKRTTTIVAHLKVEKNKGLRQLAAIPMILQIMAILWKDRDYMPESRVKLYEAALDYLLEFRDKRRNIKPLLSAMCARRVLAPVSLWMQESLKKDEATRADIHTEMQKLLDTLDTPPTAEAFCDYLVKRAGLLVETGGKEYLFRHKSFREYLAGVQLKDDRPYEHLNQLVAHFGEDWWEEPLRFFIALVDANVFDLFMQKLFDASQSEEMTPKQQLLLQTIIEEAPQKKVDALCDKLLEPATTASRQRVILDCLKAINKPAALDALLEFSEKKLAGENQDVINRTEEVILALGGQPLTAKAETSVGGKPVSFRNPHELYAEYILIPGGNYRYSVTDKIVDVPDAYFARYPVTNKLYRLFIAWLQAKESPVLYSAFTSELDAIANDNRWGDRFGGYFNNGKNNLAALFRSRLDEDRKYDGEDQPVVGVTWYAARAYCLWLSLLEGDRTCYCLPDEMKWEWAAGGKQGTTGQKVRPYPWSEAKGAPNSTLANYNKNIGTTTPVGNYPEGATPEGLYDMAGNVWEWMENWYNSDLIVLRGSAYYSDNSDADALRCSSRSYIDPRFIYLYVGFRVIRSSLFLPENLIP